MYLNGSQKSENAFTIRTDPAVALPEIREFQATPNGVTLGQMLTLSWNVSGASRVVITPDIGVVSAGGSKLVSPKSDTTYTINAINSGGQSTRTISVTVATPSLNSADLAVTDIFREASMIYYKVRNNGSVASLGCNAGLYYGQSQLGISYIPPLLPGEERTLYFGHL